MVRVSHAYYLQQACVANGPRWRFYRRQRVIRRAAAVGVSIIRLLAIAQFDARQRTSDAWASINLSLSQHYAASRTGLPDLMPFK